MALRLLLADSDAERREIIRAAAIARGMRLVAEVTAGGEALHIARTRALDAIVVGAQLDDMRALEAIALLADAAGEVVIVMFGNVYGPTGQAAALTAGAHGYFARGIDTPDDVMSALADLPLSEWERPAAGSPE